MYAFLCGFGSDVLFTIEHIILLSKCTSRLADKRIHIKLVSSDITAILDILLQVSDISDILDILNSLWQLKCEMFKLVDTSAILYILTVCYSCVVVNIYI